MKNKATANRLPRAKGMDVAMVYTPQECAKKTKRIVLQSDNRCILEEFITIMGMKEKFEAHEVSMPNKIVMFGPPGTGKTLSAYYLAQRLALPLIVVRLDAIIHSHLGETASNVRKIFEFAKASPCILFLDEFDAIARARETSDEVKEMSRVVNTLLQCLDEFDGDSRFIAATNLEQELDHAIWRRFDTRMCYRLPDEAARKEFIRLHMEAMTHDEELIHEIAALFAGCSFADMEQMMVKAKRKAIIKDASLTFGDMTDAYAEYKPRINHEVYS